MALRRTFRVTLALSLLLIAVGCVPQNNEPKAGNKVAKTAGKPWFESTYSRQP